MIGVELGESAPGSGEWSVLCAEVRPVEGTLTAGDLRDASYAEAIRLARAEVLRATAGRPRLPFARVSDPPQTFRQDRRGGQPRTDADYAQLARCLLAMSRDGRRHAAAHWATEFPEGGSKRTWLNRLVRARAFIDGGALTDEGMRLLYGEEYLERFHFEMQWDEALNIATIMPGDRIWRKLQQDGKDPRLWRKVAQDLIEVDVDEDGRAFPSHSPQTP